MTTGLEAAIFSTDSAIRLKSLEPFINKHTPQHAHNALIACLQLQWEEAPVVRGCHEINAFLVPNRLQ